MKVKSMSLDSSILMEKSIAFIKPKINIIIACGMYSVTCLAMYYVEYIMYGSTIDTGLVFAVVFPPLCLLFWFIRDEDIDKAEKKKTYWYKVSNILCNILIIVCTAIFGYSLYLNIYELRVYQFFAIMLFWGIVCLSKKHKKYLKTTNNTSKIVSMVYGMLLLATFLFVAVLSPCTVSNAAEKLRSYGYTNVSYATNIQNKGILNIVMGTNISELQKNDDKLGFYLFRAEKDDESYGVLVSVTHGTIVGYDLENENETLEYILNY